MINLQNDYHDIAHPKVMEKLSSARHEYLDSYGNDEYTNLAKDLLMELLDTSKFDLYFVHGGTAANILGLTSNIRSYEAIVAVRTAHIYAHETGAIELRGHRIITVDSEDGKLYVEDLKRVVESHGQEYNVLPRIVCISNTTEYGSVYSKRHLEELKAFCNEHDLLLHIDGARLGSALESSVCDYTWSDLQSLCDSFSIGGTKNGALFGEALIFFPKASNKQFEFYLKSTGAKLAKGYLMGLQYIALFETSIYQQNAKHANEMAQYFYNSLKSRKHVKFVSEVESNQIFLRDHGLKEKLEGKVRYEMVPWIDGELVVRLVTTYTTTKEEIEQVISYIGG